MASTGTYHLLSSVVRLANAKIPPHHKLHSITSLLLECLEASSAAFFLYNHEKRSFTSKISAALASPVSVPCSIRVGDGVCGRCIEENTLITSDSSCCHPDEKLPRPAKFVCALPVVEDGARYGVVLLGFPARRDIKPIDAELQDVLVEVAGVVRAIRVAELSDRRVKNINTLNALAHVLNHSLPGDELIPRIIDACHVSSGSWGTVLRLAQESNEAETFAKFVVPCGDVTKMLLGMEEESSERVASNGMSILMTDLIAEQDIPPSLVCVPLPFEGAVKGTLTFFGRIAEEGGYYNFDEEDRDLFENMGMLIANAIEGAKHYQKMVALSTDNEKKVKELTLLYRISNIMLSTVKLNKLVTITLSSLTSALAPSFDRAMLFLINDKSRVVQGMLGITAQTVAEVVDPESSEFELTERMSEISDDQVRRLQDSEFCRKVRVTRLSLDQRPSVCADAVANRRLLLCEGDGVDAELQAGLGVSSCAIAPLVAKEQVIGIIVVDNALTGRLIAEDELRFLQLLTNQAGMAIENSMLYSRLKEANKELYETQERLIQGERLAAIGEMAAGIAHELKTPLISIGGFARRLARKTSPGSDEQQSAETIIREVDRLEKMLTDILSFSRKTTICYSSFNIGEVIDETLNLIAGSLEENDIAIIREIDYASANLLADRQQLKQVFLNLIFNAQEAMKGGGTLNISVGKTLVDDEIPAVKIRIRDTGGGIPLEILNNIFNPFFTTKATGTGLGLPIVNRIITNHLGKIEVINHPPVGAEFVIVLPLHP